MIAIYCFGIDSFWNIDGTYSVYGFTFRDLLASLWPLGTNPRPTPAAARMAGTWPYSRPLRCFDVFYFAVWQDAIKATWCFLSPLRFNNASFLSSRKAVLLSMLHPSCPFNLRSINFIPICQIAETHVEGEGYGRRMSSRPAVDSFVYISSYHSLAARFWASHVTTSSLKGLIRIMATKISTRIIAKLSGLTQESRFPGLARRFNQSIWRPLPRFLWRNDKAQPNILATSTLGIYYRAFDWGIGVGGGEGDALQDDIGLVITDWWTQAWWLRELAMDREARQAAISMGSAASDMTEPMESNWIELAWLFEWLRL